MWGRLVVGNCGVDPPVRAGPPGPALRNRISLIQTGWPARGPAADQGVRPTSVRLAACLCDEWQAISLPHTWRHVAPDAGAAGPGNARSDGIRAGSGALVSDPR